MLNQELMEDHQGILMSSQMGFYPNPMSLSNSTFPSHQQSIKTYMNSSRSSSYDDHNSASLSQAVLCFIPPKPRESLSSLSYNMPQLVSRSTSNLWVLGEGKETLGNSRRSISNEDDPLGMSTTKMKKIKGRKKVREPRFCFKTMSDVDVLDDGYKWRKYGQKVVKNTLHPRSYYRCTQDNCRVKKRVERLAEDPRMVITTYEGRHAHSPSHDLEEAENGQHFGNNFW